MFKIVYKECSLKSLPKAYQERLLSIFARKKDDSCYITKFSGYTWYLWTSEYPIGRSNE